MWKSRSHAALITTMHIFGSCSTRKAQALSMPHNITKFCGTTTSKHANGEMQTMKGHESYSWCQSRGRPKGMLYLYSQKACRVQEQKSAFAIRQAFQKVRFSRILGGCNLGQVGSVRVGPVMLSWIFRGSDDYKITIWVMCFVGGFQVTLFTTGFAENAVLDWDFRSVGMCQHFVPIKKLQRVDYHVVLETALKKGVMSCQLKN